MGQESIDVYYKPLGGGVYHKYLVYTDSNGNQTAARGGPKGGFFGSVDSSGTDSGDVSGSPSNDPNVYGHGNIDTEVEPVRRRMIWNRRRDFGLEGSGSVG